MKGISKDIAILQAKAQTFLRTAERAMSDGDYDSCASRGSRSVAQDEAEQLLDAARDFVRKVIDYLDRWAHEKGET